MDCRLRSESSLLVILSLTFHFTSSHWNILSSPYKSVYETVDHKKLDLGAKVLGKVITKYATYDFNRTTYEPFAVGDWSDQLARKREKYFKFASKLDLNKCLSLMVCECCADQFFYGDYGKRMSDFFRFLEPVSNRTLDHTRWFQEIAEVGLVGRSRHFCKISFNLCKADIKRLTIIGRKKLGF